MVDAYAQYAADLAPAFWQQYEVDLRDVASRAQEATVLVAEEDGRIVGAVGLYPRSEVWPEGWAGIRVLAVSPAHRRRGIGRALVEECIRRADALGAKAIGLHTVGFMAGASELYASLGFRRLPAFEFRGESGTLVLAFGLALRPGALAAHTTRGARTP
jgi:predicted N-acetyltransferase YhbS